MPTRRRSPSIEKTARTRRAILAAATDSFLAKGYSDTRMEDIAARAAVAKGLIYVYFPDKMSLFDSVIRDVAQEPLRYLEKHRPHAGESTRSFLLRTIPPLLRDIGRSRRGAMIRLVLAEGARFPAVGDTYRRLVLEPLWARLRRTARLAYAKGELRGDALIRFPELLTAPALMGALGSHVLQGRDPSSPEDLFVALVDAFFVAPGDTG